MVGGRVDDQDERTGTAPPGRALRSDVRDDGAVRPAPGEVLHFSEDPTITVCVPHVPPTAQVTEPLVWAVDSSIAPAYWFPRDCPRVLAWVTASTSADDRDRIIGPGGGERVHAIEYTWLDAMRTVRLFAYRLPADKFRPLARPPRTRGSRPRPPSLSASPNRLAT